MPRSDPALDDYFGITSEPTAPKKKGGKSKDPALDAYWMTPRPDEPPGPWATAWERLKDLPPPSAALGDPKNFAKFFTEGIPGAARKFWETATSPEPTMGQELATAAPWLPIIPAVQDIISRTGRGFSGLLKAGAELGPEQAKPLTEALLGVATGGRGARGMAAQAMGAATPDVLTAARAGFRKPPSPPPPPPAPPPPPMSALTMGRRADSDVPLGPLRPRPMPESFAPTLEDELRRRPSPPGPRPSPPRAYTPEGPPVDVRPGTLTPEGESALRDLTGEGALLDAQGRPVTGPPGAPRTREEMRSLYKGRREPRIDIEGRAPDVGPAEPELPRAGAPEFTVGQGPKAGISPLTQPKRGYQPPPRDIRGGPPPPEPPAGPVAPLTREQLRTLYKGREPERIDLTGAPPEPLPEWFDPSRLPPKPGGPLPPPDWFDPSKLPPKPPAPGGGYQPPPPSGRPSADLGVFGLEMDKPGAPLPSPPPAAPTPNPELALRDYAAPGGTKVVQQIGDELVTWTKTDRNEWQGWVAGAHRKLTGESALNLAANPPPRVGPPTAPEIKANTALPQAGPVGVPPNRQNAPLSLPVGAVTPPPPLGEVLPVNPRALPVPPKPRPPAAATDLGPMLPADLAPPSNMPAVPLTNLRDIEDRLNEIRQQLGRVETTPRQRVSLFAEEERLRRQVGELLNPVVDEEALGELLRKGRRPPTPQVPTVRPDEPLPPMAPPERPPSLVQPPPPGAPSVGGTKPPGWQIVREGVPPKPGRTGHELFKVVDETGAERGSFYLKSRAEEFLAGGGKPLATDLERATRQAAESAAAPKPPAPPAFERLAEGGDQALIGGTERSAQGGPARPLRAKGPQEDLSVNPLLNPEGAARQAAAEGAQGGLDIGMRSTQQAAVNEWIMDQLGGTYGIALTRAKSPGSIQPAVVAKLKSLGIDPADAWNATHMEVPPPGVLDRLAELSIPKPALEAPKPLEMVKTFTPEAPKPQTRLAEAEARRTAAWERLDEVQRAFKGPGNLGKDPEYRAARQALSEAGEAVRAAQKAAMVRPAKKGAKGLWEETGSPDLNDPDHVAALVHAYGKIKDTGDVAGEVRKLPPYFKSKNGLSPEQMAQAILEDYPHLMDGDVAAVRDQVLDIGSRYKELRRDKAARQAKQGGEFDVSTTVPGREGTGQVPKADTLFNKALDWWDTIGTDESGAINTKAFKQRWTQFRDLFPQESAVRQARPNSPVLAEIERATAQLADWTHERVNKPWAAAVKKMDPEALKDAEQLAEAEWVRNGKTPAAELAARHHFTPEAQLAMRQRDVLFDRANRSRSYFDLEPIKKHQGPYLPREVTGGREAVSLRNEDTLGQPLLSQRPGGHGEKRALGQTYREAERTDPNIEYMDPRNAILYRDWQDMKIIGTEMLFKNLEKKGALFRDESAARAASPTGRPWKVENAPGNFTWYAPTEAEAKLLEQNLTAQGGKFGALVQYGNALFRNPNLVNPAPHVVKNMLWKMTLADPAATARLARDTVELNRGSNPARLAEFKEAGLLGAASHRTAGESLQRGLVRTTLPEKIGKGALETLGKVNEPSRRVIFGGQFGGKFGIPAKEFSGMDTAMRYSLFKRYRDKGMDVYEAGNHTWEDLIRYGTRSTATDLWKSVPLNFYVPWRYGTFAALMKQGRNHFVRTALLVGAADYLREVDYRQRGKWFHMPQDYSEKPIVAGLEAAAKEGAGAGVKKAASTAAQIALLGPGGESAAKDIQQAWEAINGRPHSADWERLQNVMWGVSQLYNVPKEAAKGNYGAMMSSLLLGEHNALNYEPTRWTRMLPESLPGMKKAGFVQEAEDLRQRRQELRDRREQRREDRGKPPTIEERLRASGAIR